MIEFLRYLLPTYKTAMRKIIVLLIASLSLLFNSATAQKISGRVLSQLDEPIQGATIKAQPSGNSTQSNADGSFELTTANDGSFVVSAVGYLSQTISITSATTYEVKLQLNVSQLEDVVVVGSRRAQRSRYNSIAPVDVVKLSDVQLQIPQIGTNELLNQFVPSFNAQRQSASDGTEHIDPASLRGLGPDQVLVLINGKRRHTTSLINYQNTVGNGAVGTDLNAIPTSAIDRIEVLRDGASAQYGSDAIAGVINIVLKKNSGFTASTTGGVSSRNDGALFNVNANYGFSFNKGFLNLTLESNHRGATNRTQNHDLIIFDQSAMNNYFAYAFTDDPAASRAYDDEQLKQKGLTRNDFNFHVGDAKVVNNQGFFNFGLNTSDKTELYAFGGVSVRKGTGYGFRRLPSETQNVVASLFPLGFQPTLNSDIVDYSLAVGVRQQLAGNWRLDISNTIGRNSFGYTVKNTNNSSMGNQSPTSFDAGSHAFLQNTVNADLSKAIQKGANSINLAFGAEYRYERYSITKGQDESWKLYPTNPGGVAGAQSFPGFTPANEVAANRSSEAVYADADFSFNNKFLVDGAARFEHYSDFGSTLNGKLSLRYNASDAFALRSSVSTGFRAPSLHQQYFSNFYSDISSSGTGIVNKGIFPVNSQVAKAIGLPDLKEETSVNYSAGFVIRTAANFTLTADAYLINIKDRIVITSSVSDPRIEALGVESGRFFTNAIDTRTKGIDAVATYTFPISFKTRVNLSLASNFNKTEITKFHFPQSLGANGLTQNDYFGPDQQSLIETNTPRSKHTLSLDLAASKFNFLIREIYWGKVTRNGFPFGVEQVHKAKVTSDLALSYKVNRAFSITAGANNIFDVFPDKQTYENSYFGVFKYAPVQMGVLGAFYYGRINIAIK